MSSPFLTTGHSRNRRALADRRRRRRRLTALGVLVIGVLAALAVEMGLASGSGEHPHAPRASTGRSAHARAPGSVASATTARSPYGFPLAKPALALTGIATPPQQDPVQISFAHPPRAALLFNLTTGQVLWQHNPYLHVPIASLTKMMTALLTVQSSPSDAPVLITRQAVEKRRRAGKLIALTMGRHGYRYPVWQLTKSGVLPGFDKVLAVLASHDEWMQTAFS